MDKILEYTLSTTLLLDLLNKQLISEEEYRILFKKLEQLFLKNLPDKK